MYKHILSWLVVSTPLKHIVHTWWLIPPSKWVITPVISGLTLLIPFITGVITHLLSGTSHQVYWLSLPTLDFFRPRRSAVALGHGLGELGAASAGAAGGSMVWGRKWLEKRSG